MEKTFDAEEKDGLSIADYVQPLRNRQLAKVYDREREYGSNHNQANRAVGRKLAAYLLAVDKSGKEFFMQQA